MGRPPLALRGGECITDYWYNCSERVICPFKLTGSIEEAARHYGNG